MTINDLEGVALDVEETHRKTIDLRIDPEGLEAILRSYILDRFNLSEPVEVKFSYNVGVVSGALRGSVKIRVVKDYTS